MSWHYLQGQEAASWEEECLDGAPVALLRLIPSQGASYCQDSETDTSTSSQSGMTSKHSMEDPGDRQLMLFQVDFPAKTSVQQVKVKDLAENVLDFGSRCSELLERLGLVLSSRKTLRTSVPVDLAPSSKDLAAWGMTSDGACWELGTSVRLTNGIESGSLLATPTAKANQLAPSMQKWQGCRNWLLPTPTANQTWKSNQGGRAGKVGKIRQTLSGMAESGMWPTPAAHNAKDCGSPSQGKRHTPSLPYMVGGPLNPNWVEWLMGWPIGWTDLEPLGTVRFQEWQQKHSQSYLTDGCE